MIGQSTNSVTGYIGYALIGLYTDQITKDYQASRLDKERLILLSHLSQEQSKEVLETNLKVARIMESNLIHVTQTVGNNWMKNTCDMEKHIHDMLERNRAMILHSLMESTETITPYDVNDMQRLLESQKAMMADMLAKNVQLVTENSELRMHMSLMPVEYREFVKNMQTSNHQQHRERSVAPKDVPLGHPPVQCLRDRPCDRCLARSL